MARDSCARCLRYFEESDLTVVGGELVCPRCQPTSPPEPQTAPDAPPGGNAIIAAARRSPDGGGGGIVAAAREWATGRRWWARAPLLIYMAYVLVRHASSPWYPNYRSLFGWLNFGIHEAGHLLLTARVFGMTVHLAAGSAFQCLVPLLCILVFLKQRDFFGMVFCLGWCGINIFEVGDYVADSQARNWTLVSPASGEPMHDWAHLLTTMGVHLKHAVTIARGFRVAGAIAMLAFLIPGSWLTWRMWITRAAGPRQA